MSQQSTIKQLRLTMRQRRKQLSAATQASAAAKLAETLTAQMPASTRRVALYLASDGEICPSAFINTLWQQKIDVFLPVLHPFSAGNLLFLRYLPTTPMRLNKYGIREPTLDVTQVCPVNYLDIIYTPLVAFDAQGNRIGMGGGYYDRTLAKHPTIKTIGLAHDCQQVDKLSTQPWDIGLTHIATPSQFITA